MGSFWYDGINHEQGAVDRRFSAGGYGLLLSIMKAVQPWQVAGGHDALAALWSEVLVSHNLGDTVDVVYSPVAQGDFVQSTVAWGTCRSLVLSPPGTWLVRVSAILDAPYTTQFYYRLRGSNDNTSQARFSGKPQLESISLALITDAASVNFDVKPAYGLATIKDVGAYLCNFWAVRIG